MPGDIGKTGVHINENSKSKLAMNFPSKIWKF